VKLKWDVYSDQPEVIRDKQLKKSIYKSIRWDSFKMLVTNILVYPFAYGFYLFTSPQKKSVDTNIFFGMSVNLDKNPEETRKIIDDLHVNSLLIRIPLHDIENLQSYLQFSEQFKGKDIVFNILQDRRHVEDLQLLEHSLDHIFSKFQHLSNRFQIGNAINRKKWAFFSMDEFLKFYKVAEKLKYKKYPKLILLGSSIIDFEYYFTLRTLFNMYKVHFDQCSSLLYVDRRGAPENTQMGLDLRKKLYLLHAMLRLSPKSSSDIVITETNWPITKTHPYAPTSEKECVSLEEHADFLVRYYLLAMETGVVKNVFWHQLIAPGYGLIDNRNNDLIKYPAYQAFKVMLSLLQGITFIKLIVDNGVYRMIFSCEVEVCWFHSISGVSKTRRISLNGKQVISRDGKEIPKKGDIDLSGSPIYLVPYIKGEKVSI
jgi:hypothetical protein